MVTLLRPYMGYSSGVTVALPDATEAALIAQGLATASTTSSMPAVMGGPDQPLTVGGNVSCGLSSGVGTPTYYQGPLNLPCIPLGSIALTGYETNGTAPTAGTMYLTEIYVPYTQTWTGIGVLNGTTASTDKMLVALYGTDGKLLANSAVAGTTSSGASAMQNRAFTSTITLPPGRYFLGVQSNGTTATLRHLVDTFGANVCTGSVAGTFGTVPATITPPATHTTAVGVIAQLYV